jgi:hypothetical protein
MRFLTSVHSFERHEDIQHAAAHAWCSTTLAAVKFNDEALIDRSTRALEDLAGIGQHMPRWSYRRQPAMSRIVEQRQRAKVAVDAWRAQNGANA